ncbi:hypothetical protein BC826DRAFT_90903 [Russula brevipes]|nr:hypothetical protein BC826DRAFT_90903 [Russula brevipes]
MVDELSKKVITVPICLRKDGAGGFPPPDSALREWLLSRPWEQETIMTRLRGFVYSLLTVTRERLEGLLNGDRNEVIRGGNGIIDLEKLATTFHDRMAEGQSFQRAGQYRQDFFQNVCDRAEIFVKESQPQESSVPKLLVPKLCESEEMSVVLRKGVQKAGEELAGFLNPAKRARHSASATGEDPADFVSPSKPRYSDRKPRMPIVILAFDEVHELVNPASTEEGNKWSLFSELCRVLRELRESPIFSLFLSTASKFIRCPCVHCEGRDHYNRRRYT